ncbi:MAG: SGNH/GDSL hydrolase family protein [Clostridiales bacterium]|nr:SGNH/GDSL hydrolase family protein [Clostridiales bacterium]
MNKKKFGLRVAAVCFLFIAIWLLQRLLMPKYVSAIVEGSLIEEYYREETSHDVIFVGDCEVYENISPIALWDNYGITSFIRGGAQQLIWQSYYLLEETFKYEKPEVAVFNILAMQYDEPQSEAYNRLNLDGMRMSKEKIKSINASMMEDEHLAEYLFPLLRYHSRWNELSWEDFKYIFNKDKISHNGYYMRVDIQPVKTIPKPKKLPSYEFGEKAWEYLNRMVELCKENDVQLVLIKAPSIYPHWYDEWDAQIKEYSEEHDLLYINLLQKADEVGIDYNTDTYNGGLHLNISGAEKVAVYLGNILKETYGLKDHRDEPELSSVWQEKSRFYNEMREKQLRELEEYGYLKSLGVEKRED